MRPSVERHNPRSTSHDLECQCALCDSQKGEFSPKGRCPSIGVCYAWFIALSLAAWDAVLYAVQGLIALMAMLS